MMMKKNEKLELRDVAVDAAESTELVEVPEKKQPKKIWLLLAAAGPRHRHGHGRQRRGRHLHLFHRGREVRLRHAVGHPHHVRAADRGGDDGRAHAPSPARASALELRAASKI